jgi:regulator of nucleoside diphosphate kinase
VTQPFVSLRPEITRTHAMILMDWLEDERVTRYLSDSRNVSRFIAQAVDRTPLPILTHLFNQGGRFFMVYDRHDQPVGFVRLIKSGPQCEIVLAIGDLANWGRRLGRSAIREGLKLAFLEMRADSVVARIHPENVRSVKAFERCGFELMSAMPTLVSMSMTRGRYLRLLRDGAMADTAGIYVTELDKSRLEVLIGIEDGPVVVDLEHELERAIIVPPQVVSPNVVTMNSRVALQLDGEETEVSLVYPEDADESAGRVSVLSDVGAAILGYQEGDELDWIIDDRTRRIVIERVIYQPESAGHLHL